MKIQCRSYAKINWALEVLGQRPDGYHEIRTILQTIDLHDLVTIERLDGGTEISCDDPSVPCDERNLAYRAVNLFRQRSGAAAGARIHIAKRIPIAGGLGGGSSNAAVVLLALRRLWHAPLPVGDLIEVGAAIGSDVPFFFYGGTAVGTGRGTEVYPLPDISAQHLLLVTPAGGVSTPAAYAALSRARRLTSSSLQAKIPDCCTAVFRTYGPLTTDADALAWTGEAGNDLEPVVVAQYPEIGEILGWLGRLGAKMTRMSGSGSTAFAVFDSEAAVESAEQALAGRPWRVAGARTVGRSEYWETLINEP